MAQCTAQGYGDKPGLPAVEMRELKEEICKLYPNYLNNSLVFEGVDQVPGKYKSSLQESTCEVEKEKNVTDTNNSSITYHLNYVHYKFVLMQNITTLNFEYMYLM